MGQASVDRAATPPVAGVAETKPDRGRKRPKDAPTHVIAWPLRPHREQERWLGLRFDYGVRVYNACLGHAVKLSRRVKADPGYAAAQAMPVATVEDRQARRQAFDRVAAEHGFSRYSLLSYGSGLRQGHVRDHVDAHTAQTLAHQAWRAVSDWHYGRHGKPRFKSVAKAGRGLHSITGKDLNSALRPHLDTDGLVDAVQWTKGQVVRLARPKQSQGRKGRESRETWGRLSGAVAAGRVVFVRVVRSRKGTGWAYQAQFTVDGPAPRRLRAEPAPGTRLCVDFGPSHAGLARLLPDGTWTSETFEIAPGMTVFDRELARLQRRLDRQHRAGSPECFHPDGRHKHGLCHWGRPGAPKSRRAQHTESRITYLQARMAAYRHTAHGYTANRLAEAAQDLRVEQVSYRAWATSFPHATRHHGVGGLVSRLESKAASAGSTWWEFPTRSTRLSQTCLCGHRDKKPLSQRVHRCPACGLQFDRDEFSAFLGLAVEPADLSSDGHPAGGQLRLEHATRLWPCRAWQAESVFSCPEPASGGGASCTIKRRGHRPPAPSRRSQARITARHQRRTQVRQSRSTGQAWQPS